MSHIYGLIQIFKAAVPELVNVVNVLSEVYKKSRYS